MLKRFLCVFLSVVMMLTMIPVGAYAKEEITKISCSEEENIEIEYEIESKRTENSKTYITSDGGYYQVTALVPIHEKVNGTWEDIEEPSVDINTPEDAVEYISNEAVAVSSNDSSALNDYYSNENVELIGYSAKESKFSEDLSITGTSYNTNYVLVRPKLAENSSIYISSAKLNIQLGSSNLNYPTIYAYKIKTYPELSENGKVVKQIAVDKSYLFDSVDFEKIVDENNVPVNYAVDLTTYCQNCSLGTFSNTGIALSYSDKKTNVTLNQGATLSVYYRELADVDSKFDSESIDLGRAGTVYINDYNCSPVIVRDEISIFNERQQASIQTIYNPNLFDSNETDGIQTRTNYYSTIEYINGEYQWKNCNGENVYFVLSESSSETEKYYGISSSGEKYELVLSANNGEFEHTQYNKIKITDDSYNYSFGIHSNTGSKLGYLTKITSIKYPSNSISISYTSLSNSIEDNIYKVTDCVGKVYRYNYTDNKLSSIDVLYTDEDEESGENITANSKINDQNIQISFEYTDDKMSKVTYADGYTVNYSYNENGKLENVSTNDADGNEVNSISFTYKYNDDTHHALSNYEVKKRGIITESVDIDNSTNSVYERTFNNITKGITKTVQYNNQGNLIKSDDYDGTVYYLDYYDNNLSSLIYEDIENNYVTNGEFDEDLKGWKTSNTGDIYVDDDSPLKQGEEITTALYVSSEEDECYVEQTIEKPFSKDDTFLFSADAVLTTACLPPNDTRTFKASVYYKNSLGENIILGSIDFDHTFVYQTKGNPNRIGWQRNKTIITIPEDITELTISLNFDYMLEDCYFDSVALYPATPENTVDVSDGSLTSEYTLNYNSNGTLSSETKTGYNSEIGTYYTYDSSDYLSSVNNQGSITYYNYDHGNGLLQSKGINSDSSKNVQFSYNGIGALTAVKQALTQIDGTQINRETTYKYNDDNRIECITHNDCIYKYTYDENGYLTNISIYGEDEKTDDSDITPVPEYSISYGYTKDNVDLITYGNGSTITYEYDGDCITSIIYDNGLTGDANLHYVYSYTYDSNGKVTSFTDNVNNTVTTYSDTGYTITKDDSVIYSNNGKTNKLFGSTVSITSSNSGSGDSLKTKNSYVSLISSASTEYTRDSLGRKKQSEFSSSLKYDISNSIDSYKTIPGTNKATNLVEHSSFSISSRVDSLLKNERLAQEYTYEYNDSGQITDIYLKTTVGKITRGPRVPNSYQTENGDLINHYEYDEAGQIVLEVNLEDYVAITYTYDLGGNLIKKTTYDNSRSSSLTGDGFSFDITDKTIKFNSSGKTVNYIYKSNGLKDYISSYDGYSIPYDKAGNPTYYRGTALNGGVDGNMVWNGNLLTAFYNYSDYYEYKYDGDGRRTYKAHYDKSESLTQPVNTTEYIWEGDTLAGYRFRIYDAENDFKLVVDRVVKLIYDGDELLGLTFTYDYTDKEYSSRNTNSVIELANSNTYAFAKDGMGNIRYIYNGDEEVVVSFTYDAFGNVTPHVYGNLVQKVYNSAASSSSELIKQIIIGLVFSLLFTGQFAGVERAYKGYLYDYETGLYYFQNRYYSPTWGRYINVSDPLTVKENVGEVNGTNLFNFCDNDPINNTSKTGFNVRQTAINNNILPALGMNKLFMSNENMATASSIGEISRILNNFGAKLGTNTNSSVGDYWDRKLGRIDNTVEQKYSTSYINSLINKNSSSVTKYSVNYYNTPYRIAESVN